MKTIDIQNASQSNFLTQMPFTNILQTKSELSVSSTLLLWVSLLIGGLLYCATASECLILVQFRDHLVFPNSNQAPYENIITRFRKSCVALHLRWRILRKNCQMIDYATDI